MHQSKIQGKKLSFLEDAYNGYIKYKTTCTAGDPKKLFNFKVNGKTKQGDKIEILILDNYGDDWTCDKIKKHSEFRKTYNLGINTATGELYYIYFISENNKYGFAFHFLGMSIPKEYIPKLDQLLCKKRPYHTSIDFRQLYMFIDREIGYSEISDIDNLIITLDFNEPIEVKKHGYRIVSDWK